MYNHHQNVWQEMALLISQDKPSRTHVEMIAQVLTFFSKEFFSKLNDHLGLCNFFVCYINDKSNHSLY